MTKKYFLKNLKKIGFDKIMSKLYEESQLITDYDSLKNYIIDCINNDNNMLALHLLTSVYNSKGNSIWYYYDYTAGTYCTPICLNSKEDVENVFNFEIEN